MFLLQRKFREADEEDSYFNDDIEDIVPEQPHPADATMALDVTATEASKNNVSSSLLL